MVDAYTKPPASDSLTSSYGEFLQCACCSNRAEWIQSRSLEVYCKTCGASQNVEALLGIELKLPEEVVQIAKEKVAECLASQGREIPRVLLEKVEKRELPSSVLIQRLREELVLAHHVKTQSLPLVHTTPLVKLPRFEKYYTVEFAERKTPSELEQSQILEVSIDIFLKSSHKVFVCGLEFSGVYPSVRIRSLQFDSHYKVDPATLSLGLQGKEIPMYPDRERRLTFTAELVSVETNNGAEGVDEALRYIGSDGVLWEYRTQRGSCPLVCISKLTYAIPV